MSDFEHATMNLDLGQAVIDAVCKHGPGSPSEDIILTLAETLGVIMAYEKLRSGQDFSQAVQDRIERIIETTGAWKPT